MVKTLFTASNVDFSNQITGTPVSAAMGDLQCSVKSTLEVGLYKEYPVYRGLQLAMKERERILFLNILCLYCFLDILEGFSSLLSDYLPCKYQVTLHLQ